MNSHLLIDGLDGDQGGVEELVGEEERLQPVDQLYCNLAVYAEICELPRDGYVLLSLSHNESVWRRFIETRTKFYPLVILGNSAAIQYVQCKLIACESNDNGDVIAETIATWL